MIIQQFVLTSNHCKLPVPVNAKILCAKKVGKDIQIFVELDETKPVVERKLIAIPSGATFPVLLAVLSYIDTVQMGDIFWHIYEVKE